jgi:curved DNA-binding protein CbpA
MPQTPRFELHRRRIFILVIVSYLLYTLYETFHQVQVAGNYYTLLDVTPFDTDKTIQSKFRRLAARYHPDKIGHQDGADILFMLLRQAEETLLDPVQRFAYDRFGPDALKWGGQLKTTQEFFMISLTRLVLPQYVMSLAAMLVLNWLWWGGFGRYVSHHSTAQHSTGPIILSRCPRLILIP